MRRGFAGALVALLALSACVDHETAGPDINAGRAVLSIRANVAGTAVAMVVVEVTAADIATPVIANIATVGGVADGAISVPAGSSRTITLHAYDAGGVQTHTGSATLNVQAGINPPISIVLAPLAGSVPITVTLGSFKVTVTPATATVAAGDTVRLTATVLDATNNPITDQVTWATLGASVATVVSTGQQTARVTAVGSGQTTVVAVYGGIAGGTTITVNTTGGLYPVHVEAGKRYLIDAHGDPFLLQGDAAWSLIAELTNAQAEQYLEDRKQKGFNTVLVNLIEHEFSTNPPNNAYGDAPFLTPGDFSTPNEAYFAHAAYVLNLAAQKGMLVLLTPAYMGYGGGSEGWYQEMETNGTTKLSNYGTYLANRFRFYDNIVWVEGGDYNPPDLNLLRAIPNAIRAVEPKWLHTFHGDRGTSASGFLGTGEPWLQLNNIYTDKTDVIANAFEEYGRSTMPFFLIEAIYENESGAGEWTVRHQAYHAVLSGATGQVMGNRPVWLFDTGWELALDSPGATMLSHLPGLLAGRAWWTLVPDTNHTVLTDSVGTGADEAATARASDGSFVLSYLPRARPVTINMARLSGPNVIARWYDPGTGTYTPIAGSPFPAAGSYVFPSAGENGDGLDDYDWVLVLESSP